MDIASDESMSSEFSSPQELNLPQIKTKIITGEYKVTLKNGKSKVWEVFGNIERGGRVMQNVVACKNCSSVYKFKNSTSNLVKHKCFKNLKDNLVQTPKIDVDHNTKDQVVRVTTEWLIKNCRSFKMIEDDGLNKFVELILSIGEKYGSNVDVDKLLPHPTTISRNIDKLYINAFDSIKTEIQEVNSSGYGLTSDLWSDNFIKMSYLSLTIHFIRNGKIETKLLALRSMDFEPCNSERILRKVTATLNEFNCSLEKALIVTDRGSNMKAAFSANDHIFCINHLLHNIVEKSIKTNFDVNEICMKCTKLVKYFKKSGANSQLTTTLKSFSPTRWNTIYYLLHSVHNNWVEIGNILHEKNQLQRISGINLNVLTATIKLLKNFEETSKELEGDSYPTLHLTIVHIYFLKRSCGVQDDDLECIKSLKQSLETLLNDVVMQNLTIFHKIALFLFPPTNKLTQFTNTEKEFIKENCKKMMACYISDTNSNENENPLSEPLTNEKEILFSGFLQTISPPSNIDRVQNELTLYENVNEVMHNNFDVLQWWEFNKVKYPLLYKLSCKILATPASSASSERIFSSARSLLSEKRCLIGSNPVSVEKIMFLHSNMK